MVRRDGLRTFGGEIAQALHRFRRSSAPPASDVVITRGNAGPGESATRMPGSEAVGAREGLTSLGSKSSLTDIVHDAQSILPASL
jgi:hypothetical protein